MHKIEYLNTHIKNTHISNTKAYSRDVPIVEWKTKKYEIKSLTPVKQWVHTTPIVSFI